MGGHQNHTSTRRGPWCLASIPDTLNFQASGQLGGLGEAPTLSEPPSVLTKEDGALQVLRKEDGALQVCEG